MTYDNHFHIAFYCAATLVSLTTVVFTKLQRKVDRTQSRLFLMMNYIVLLNSITLLICSVVEPYRYVSNAVYSALLFFEFLYFIVHTLLAPTLFFYVLSVTGSFERRSSAVKFLYSLPLLITEILVFINPVFHYVYYYDEQKNFTRNWAELIIYFAAAIYFAVSMGNLFFSWSALTRRKRCSLFYFLIILLSGVVIQYVEINIKSELFGEALALLGLMLAVENEDYRLDSDTGFYNRRALITDLDHMLITKNVFYVVCVKVTNTDSIRRITGSLNADYVAEVVSQFLMTLIPRYYIYHSNPDTMVLLLQDYQYPRGEADALALAEKINDRFSSDFSFNGIPVKLTCNVVISGVPKDLQTIHELLYMIDTPVPEDIEKAILTGKDLGFLIRRADVETAIRTGLKDNNFEVYYQPTYCADDLTIHGAEALIRLNDPNLGKLYPDEFIPIAEQIGFIYEIDDFVLREVCSFLKSGAPTQCGMDCINVNLSVLQCMQDNFVEHILEIVNSYGIDKSLINFEITESVSASDYNILSDVIKALKSNGFQFSMDDYGTGYSNMHSLFSLAFDIIKIDKSILWGAETSALGEIILESCVNMIRQMGRKILVEGVETKAHVNKLHDLGVDYLQGYYFSRPVPQKELLAVISSQQ